MSSGLSTSQLAAFLRGGKVLVVLPFLIFAMLHTSFASTASWRHSYAHSLFAFVIVLYRFLAACLLSGPAAVVCASM